MLKAVSVNEVRLGMYIHALKGAWVDHPFWQTKFILKEPADLEKLRLSSIKEVVIDVALGLDVLSPPPTVTAPSSPPISAMQNLQPSPTPQKHLSVDEERHQAARIIQSARSAVAAMFKDMRLGKAIDANAVMPLVDEISDSVSRNSHALVSLVRLKTADDYTYMHSVAVCALMTALAKELQLSESEVRQAGLAGLMHDIGKAKIPLEVLNKPGALTQSEFAMIQRHPELGHAKLLKANVTDVVTLDVSLHHHEKVDGSGYPHGLKSEEISLFSKMGAVCDVYDAVTSSRPYKAAWEPGVALKRMASWEGHFDPGIFKAFVKSLGIYPVGTLVKLKSGRLAVVVEQNKNLLKPVVKVFYSTQSRMYLPVTTLDLSLGMDEVASNESPASWGIQSIDHLWAT